MIDLDIWDAYNLKMQNRKNGGMHVAVRLGWGTNPKNQTARYSKSPLMLVVSMEQVYDEFTLFFMDGNYIYRLMYMMQEWRTGLEVFYRMVNTLKSKSLSPDNPVMPTLDID